MDPGCAPQSVFPAHPSDQIPQAAIDLWPPYPISGFPTLEHFEASAMPPQDGLRLHRIANIGLNDAMNLHYHANLGRIEFLERTGRRSAVNPKGARCRRPL